MSRQTQIGIRCAGLTLATVFGFFMAMACGGGGSSGGTTTDDSPSVVTIAISGTVAGPTVSSSLSAKRLLPAKTIWKKFGSAKKVQKAISGTALLPGLTVECFTIGGTSLGSGTTDADGAFTLDVDLDLLKPADTEDTSWSAPVFCSAKSDDGKTDLKIIATVGVVEGTTTDVAIGIMNVESTITAATILDDLGCDPTNKETCSVPSGLNIQCLSASLGQGVWSQVSDISESTFFSNLGALQNFVKVLYAAGVNWSELTCKAAGTCVSQIMNGTLNDADLAAIVSAASSVEPDLASMPFSDIKSGLAESGALATTVLGVLKDSLAGTSDGITVCANLIAGGSDFAKVSLQPLLALPSNAAALASALFQPNAFQVIGAVLGNASPTDLDGFGPFMLGYLANAQEEDSTLANISGSSGAINYLVAAGKFSTGLGTDTLKKNYAAGCFNAFTEIDDSDFCLTDCDVSVGLITAPFAQANFNSDAYNYGESKTLYSEVKSPSFSNEVKAAILACASIANPQARTGCLVALFENYGDDDGDGGNDNGGGDVDNNDNSDDIESIFAGSCNGTSTFSYAQAQSALLNCNDGNALRNMYVAAHNNHDESGCMTLVTINLIAGSYGVDLNCGGGDDEGGDGGPVCGNFLCEGTEALDCSQDCGGGGDDGGEPEATLYWDGTWFSNDISCFPDISVTSGQNTLPVIRFDAPSDQSGSGTCHIYNADNSQAMGCSYTGAGLGSTAGLDTVITISGWPSTWCDATLTKIDPPEEDPAPDSPGEGYFEAVTTPWYADVSCPTSTWDYYTMPITTFYVSNSGVNGYYGLTFEALTSDSEGGGNCSITNISQNRSTTSCTYTNAGMGIAAGGDTIITAVNFPSMDGTTTTDCTVTLTKTIPSPPEEEALDHYFAGTWYTSIPTCGVSTWNYLNTPETFVINASGVAAFEDLTYDYSLTFHAQDNLSSDPPLDYTGSGFCKINNDETGETFSETCTYENAGTGTAVDGTAIIKTTTFPLRTGAGYTDCSVILTREAPMLNYWDGYWSETVDGITSCTLLTPFTIADGSATFGGNTVSIDLPATYSDHGECDGTVIYNGIEGVPGCAYQDVEVNSFTMRGSVNDGARLIITVWDDGIHEAGCTMDVTKGPAPAP